MLKIITDQFGKKGFIVQGTCITNPYYDETMRFEVDPIEYYGLTEDQLIQFEHLKPEPKEPEPSYEELIQKMLVIIRLYLIINVLVIPQIELMIPLNFLMNIVMEMMLLKI